MAILLFMVRFFIPYKLGIESYEVANPDTYLQSKGVNNKIYGPTEEAILKKIETKSQTPDRQSYSVSIFSNSKCVYCEI